MGQEVRSSVDISGFGDVSGDRVSGMANNKDNGVGSPADGSQILRKSKYRPAILDLTEVGVLSVIELSISNESGSGVGVDTSPVSSARRLKVLLKNYTERSCRNIRSQRSRKQIPLKYF